MNGSVPAMIDAVRRSLREAVQPELTSDHARAQLAGVMDILSKLERMTDWSQSVLDEQQRTLVTGLGVLAGHADELGVDLPAHCLPGPGGLAQTQDRVRELTDWLFTTPMDSAARSQLDALLRQALREDVVAQRRRIPRADFSSMTASSD